MSARGGSRPGAGRKPGSKNKATIERETFAAEGIKAAIDGGVSPLEVMLQVMRGDADISDRQFQAAQAAAPYVHPRLSAVDATTKGERLSGFVLAAPFEDEDVETWQSRHGRQTDA